MTSALHRAAHDLTARIYAAIDSRAWARNPLASQWYSYPGGDGSRWLLLAAARDDTDTWRLVLLSVLGSPPPFAALWRRLRDRLTEETHGEARRYAYDGLDAAEAAALRGAMEALDAVHAGNVMALEIP